MTCEEEEKAQPLAEKGRVKENKAGRVFISNAPSSDKSGLIVMTEQGRV